MSRFILSTVPLLALALAACGDGERSGGPAGPLDPGPPPAPTPELAIVWDGDPVSWGDPVTLRAEVDEGAGEIEWVSLDDHYLQRPVVLGRGEETTTQALRPGVTTVEARLIAGGEIAATGRVDVTVSYRPSWRVVEEGRVPYPAGTVGDVWVSDGHAFVARRNAGGISIVQLAGGPVEVGRFTAPTLFTQDVKAADGIAYVSHEPLEGNAYLRSVTLLDVSDPRAPKVAGGIPLSEVRSVHNVFVEGDVLGVTDIGDFDLYDVSDPSSPRALGTVRPENGRAHDLHLRQGRLYGAFLTNEEGLGELTVADVTSPGVPAVLSRVRWEGSFTHSAWPSPDGRYLYVCDEKVNAPIRILDVSNPAAARVVATYQPRLGTIPHNFQVRDDGFAYLAHYKHGVEVVDVSDPLNPRLVGFHDTHPGAANDDLLFGAAPTGGLQAAHEKGEGVFEGAWGVHWDDTGRIVVSDMQQGLFVLRYTGP